MRFNNKQVDEYKNKARIAGYSHGKKVGFKFGLKVGLLSGALITSLIFSGFYYADMIVGFYHQIIK